MKTSTMEQIERFEGWREDFKQNGAKPATLNGRWPTGTFLQNRRAELKRREAAELEQHNE